MYKSQLGLHEVKTLYCNYFGIYDAIIVDRKY